MRDVIKTGGILFSQISKSSLQQLSQLKEGIEKWAEGYGYRIQLGAGSLLTTKLLHSVTIKNKD